MSGNLVFGQNRTNNSLHAINVDTTGVVAVDVHAGGTGSGDMKARSDIADPATSTFIKCNADGTLEMTAELDSSGLAKESKQDTQITALDAIVIGVSYNDDIANRTLLTAQNQTNGNQKAKCMGNNAGTDVQIKVDANGVVETSGGGGGAADSTAANQVLQLAQETIIAGDTTSIDAKITACNTGAIVGAVSITGTASVAGTVSVSNLPAVGQLAMAASLPVVIASNQSAIAVNGSAVTQPISASALPLPSGATSEASLSAMSAKLPASLGQKANSASLATCRSNTAGAYDLSGRTTIATASTSTKLLCDSDGHLQVDILSGGGGDATAANQVIQETTLDAIEVLVTAGNVDLAALEVLQTAANVDLAAIEVLQTKIAGSHYTDNQSFGASDTGVVIMGRDGSNLAQPIHITNNGDVEVEIADFVKGQAAMTASFPVVLASDQAAIPVTVSSLPLPSGGATAALQTTQETTLDAIEVLVTAGNAILSTIDTDTGAMVVDLAAIEISNAAIKVATEASAVDLAALEVLSTAANVDLAAIEVLQTTIAGDTTSIDGKITACNTGAVVLAAGSASIGKLGANSGVDIGDVDVTSLPAKTNSDTTLWSASTSITNGATLTSAVIDKNGAYRLSAAIAVDANGGSGYSIQAQGSANNTTYFDVGMPQMLTNPSLSKSIEFDTSFRYVKIKITNSVGSDRSIVYSVASHCNGL